MGTKLLSEFRTDLATALGRPSLNVGPYTVLDALIHGGYREVAYAFRFSELEAVGTFVTVDGTLTYDLKAAKADFRMLHEEGLRKTAPSDRLGKLKKETRSSYLRKIGDTNDSTQRASPEFYHRFGQSTVYLRPVPDSTIVTVEFDYWKLVTKLTNPGDVTLLSEDWDDIVFLGALYRGFRNQGEHDKYLNNRADFLGQIRSRALEEDVEEFPQGTLNIQLEDDSSLVSE